MIVSKSHLKAKMLEYFRQVEKTGEALVVTSNGKPVLKVVPFRERTDPDTLFAAERGRVIYRDDPLANTSDEWPEK